jgi:hypothetical protein
MGTLMAQRLAGEHQLSGQAWLACLPRIAQRDGKTQDRQIGWAVWALFLTAICALATFGPRRTVTPAYYHGAAQWVAGLPLYNDEGIGFIYLPQAAILFAPFTALPPLMAEVFWRCFTIGIYAWGVRRFSALAENSSPRPLFALASLIAIPLAGGSARNGQATLLMAGLMMAAVACMATRSWWRAAGCLVLALAIKPLAIVLILLSAALYRPMIGRLLIAACVMLAIPFLTQDSAYVQSQYLAYIRTVQAATDHSNVEYFAQLFGLLRVVGLEVPSHVQTLLRALFAGLTLLACLWYSRRMDAARWGVYFYSLSTCYLMLFNPRTENNTYSMLAPAIAVFFAWALIEGRLVHTVLLGAIAFGTVGTFEFGRLLTPAAQSIWLAPLMAIGFSGCVIADLFKDQAAAPRLPAGMLAKPGRQT